jgi:hypothetical protein
VGARVVNVDAVFAFVMAVMLLCLLFYWVLAGRA